MRNKFHIYAYCISIFAIFALIYYPAFYIPFHSDDYSYFLKGTSFKAHLEHYLGWSGRFIADYISSVMLNYFSKPIYMAINSFALIIVIIALSFLPPIIMKQKLIDKNSWLMLWFLFITYWIANPNLGQTTFWLVGSANYLWTIMWASLYFLFLLYLLTQEKEIDFKKSILLILLGFFTGLSNEATGISSVLFTIILFFIYKRQKKILTIALLSIVIGFSFLYFAPGNFKRLHCGAFNNWLNMPMYDKIYMHIFDRMPQTFGLFWLIFIDIIFLFIILSFSDKNKEKNIKSYIFICIFFILAIFSIFVFIKSPAMPPRSKNTCLFFLIICISFLTHTIIRVKESKSTLALIIIISSNLIYFIPSYVFFTYAIKNTAIQAQIRDEIINKAKSNKEQSVKIPDWYFTKLLNNSDKFDMYRSGAMPRYYGVKNIEWTNALFEYSITKTQTPTVLNLALINDLKLDAIFYSNGHNIFDKNKLILQFNHSLLNYIKNGDNILYLHIFTKNNSKFINKDINIEDFTQIGEKFYYAIVIDNIKLQKLKSLDFGFYNSTLEQNSASFSLNLENLEFHK